VPRIALCAAILAAVALGGCSLKANDNNSGDGGISTDIGGAPVIGAKSDDKNATEKLGFPITATRNTTRVAGNDPVADAAGVASALFPASEAATRPPAVVIVDKDDWQGIVAAGALSGAPIRAPILLSSGDSLPAVTDQTLTRLAPKGITVPAKTQAILVGDKPPPPDKLKSTVIKGSDPYALAASVDRFSAVAHGKASPNVIVASGEQSEFAIPAAAWAARSGDAVLFTKRDQLPSATVAALKQHEKPHIWVLGPTSVISSTVEKQLGRLGKVTRVSGDTAVDNAIEFARFKRGWAAVVPGQNLTVASATRPGDAAAAAGLGANGVFAPLLLTDRAQPLPRSLESYLLDVQPGFEGGDPSQGVYNHVWILGGGDAVSPASQDRIDAASALVPVDQSASR
jgi:hypothetical protein